MRLRALVAAGVAMLLSGCINYHFYSGGEASCLELIPLDARVPQGYVQWLRYWQSTPYCERVRARWFSAPRPDLIVERMDSCPSRAGMQIPPDVWVKNQGRGDAPASDLLLTVTVKDREGMLQFETSYMAPVPALVAGMNQRVNLSAMRPYPTVGGDRITLLATVDPLQSGAARGAVLESDENNNTLPGDCTIPG